MLDASIKVSAVPPSYPTVQPLPGGDFAWVGARAAWTIKGAVLNALVFNSDGDLLSAACVGDGIQHAQTTPSGRLWLGLSDEGIFGNMGWGRPDSPAPLGGAGIVQCNARLDLQWHYQMTGMPFIDDCYALNVDDEVTWAYYYSRFPIVRIEDGRATLWPTAISGAKALITDGTRAALIGGYRPHSDRVVTGNLDTDFVESGQGTILLPSGGPIPEDAKIEGRGEQLHVFINQNWYRTDLAAM